MNLSHCALVWTLYLASAFSFCLCILRKKCQVLEKKYFAQFVDLKFYKCGEFEDLSYDIAVNCDMVKNHNLMLKEIPPDTDWLCLTNYLEVTVEEKSFSQFPSLNALYLIGNFELLPGSFLGLHLLTTLWIESEVYLGKITFHKETFDGLDQLQVLKISRVKFSVLDSSMFTTLLQLQHLTLELNNITSLSAVTKLTRNMTGLQKLSIVNNYIETLRTTDCLLIDDPMHTEDFAVFNITYLDLSLNCLRYIEHNSLCNFPHLQLFRADKTDIDRKGFMTSGIKTCQVIQLSNIFFRSFDICQYASHFKAEQILIMYNDLIDLKKSHAFCRHLKMLDISNNYLKAINYQDMKNFDGLTELKLSYNKINQFNICSNKTIHFMDLVYLNLSINSLQALQNGQFGCLKYLETLALNNNYINQIEAHTFDGLNRLYLLHLQNNNFKTIEDFTFSNLLALTHLDLYGNNIMHFSQNSFSNLPRLKEIKLASENVLDAFFLFQYIPTSVKKIFVKNEKIFLTANDLNEFKDLDFLEIEARWIFVDPCNEFNFSNLKELQLKNNMFFNCFNTLEQALENFINLEKLSYTAGYLQTDPGVITLNSSLHQLTHLKYLFLKDTFTLLESGQVNINAVFQGLSQLKCLHLLNSGIDHLDSKEIFHDLHNLEILIVEKQNIEDLTEAVFQSLPSLKYVFFLHSTFPCSCKFSGLLSWLESGTPVSILHFNDQECYIDEDYINLISFLHGKCESDLDRLMFLVTFVFTLLFMSISIFYESIWWHILYLVFTLKCWLNHRQRVRDNYEYDAFVSYNTNDEIWVTEQLLPNLEQNGPPFFKVCIHNRDFEIGKYIADNIMNSIYNSRWTVCIISHSYLRSDWCSLEMRMATYRLLTESKDSVILVILDKISREELQHYHRLTKLLDKKTYVEWPDDEDKQKLMWARLRKVISKANRH